MTAHILKGSVWHKRFQPIEHSFSYPVIMWSFYAGEYKAINKFWPIFGHNKTAIIRIEENQWLNTSRDEIAKNIEDVLKENDLDKFTLGRIKVIGIPTVFGIRFNPVRFYFVEDDQQNPKVVVIEINNTFGERSIYTGKLSTNEAMIQLELPKDFYISPFSEVEGKLLFSFKQNDNRLNIEFKWLREGLIWFEAKTQLVEIEMTKLNVFTNFMPNFIYPILTTSRILKQAAVLFLIKKLNKLPKPSLLSRAFKADKEILLQRILTNNPLNPYRVSKENR